MVSMGVTLDVFWFVLICALTICFVCLLFVAYWCWLVLFSVFGLFVTCGGGDLFAGCLGA